jgi:Uracil DNA glycosylase superfamily
MSTKAKKEKKPKKKSLKAISIEREKLSNAGPEREACKLCGLCKGKDFAMPYVPETWSGKLLAVRDGEEDKREKKFTRRLLRRAGWSDTDTAYVSALRCASGGEPSMVSIRSCRPFLLQVINVLKPKFIIGLGSTAMRALRNAGEENVTKNRGKEIRVPGL